MQAMKRSIIADVVAIAAIALLITITFYWIEARREVIILCDNFTPGVLKKSVERQLLQTYCCGIQSLLQMAARLRHIVHST